MDAGYFLQLEKSYKDYCRNIIAGLPYAPIVLRGGKKKPETTPELYKLIHLFQQFEKKENTNGWKIEWQQWCTKKLGKQLWPAVIVVETEEDYLFLLKRKPESERFKAGVQKLLSWRSEIRDFLLLNPSSVLQLEHAWDGICSVVDYLLMNNVSNHYIRSIPVPVHTKFIQDNEFTILSILRLINPALIAASSSGIEGALGLQKKSHLYLLRWLDCSLADKYTGGITLLSVPVNTLKTINWAAMEVWFVENETNLYLMPPRKNAVVIFSRGYALNELFDIPLLQQSSLLYWGDLDEDGFVMLDRIRRHYPHIKSVFMDALTLNIHSNEIGYQKEKYKHRLLEFLTPAEKAAYEILSATNGRLEQEKLYQEFVNEAIASIEK